MPIIDIVKQALRTTTNASDAELTNLTQAALIDLQFGGADPDVLSTLDPIITHAVILYCKAHFGLIDPADYDRVKKAYDEIKAQLGTATNYTNWGA